jgi:hypothetical protein
MGDMMIRLGRLIRTKLAAINIDVPVTAYVTGTLPSMSWSLGFAMKMTNFWFVMMIGNDSVIKKIAASGVYNTVSVLQYINQTSTNRLTVTLFTCVAQ